MNETRRPNRTYSTKVGRGARGASGAARQRGGTPASAEEDTAFDRWLEERLRNSYSSVLDEPIPQDLLRLLEQKLKD